MSFEGKIAVVTGGAKGIGRAIAEQLLQGGAKVVLLDVLEDALKETVAELTGQGYPVDSMMLDLRKVDKIEGCMDAIAAKHGGIDILVNNAGVQKRRKVVEFTEEDWDLVVGINLKAAYFCSRAAAKHMIGKGGGSIVCISSVNSARYASKRSLYNVSKGGLNAMVGTMGVEWARYGIRTNGIAPGFIETDMLLSGIADGLINDKELLSVIPSNRFLQTAEVASVACFLASDAASGIVGQTVFVDGGLSVNCMPEGLELE